MVTHRRCGNVKSKKPYNVYKVVIIIARALCLRDRTSFEAEMQLGIIYIINIRCFATATAVTLVEAAAGTETKRVADEAAGIAGIRL